MSEEPLYLPPTGEGRLRLGTEELEALGLAFPGGWVLPVSRGRLEFAWLVREVIAATSPTAIAVEQAESLSAAVDQAIRRLPLLSVVTYPDPRAHGRPVYLPIEPADALVEAIRRGHELGLPVWRIDREVDPPPAPEDRLPDPLAAETIGASEYLRRALEIAAGFDLRDEDAHREATMAQHLAVRLARARRDGEAPRVLVVCGVRHARRLTQALVAADAGEDTTLGDTLLLGGRRRDEIAVRHLAEASSQDVLAEMPVINAAYERARGDRPRAQRGALSLVTAEGDGEAPANVINLFGGARPRETGRGDPRRAGATGSADPAGGSSAGADDEPEDEPRLRGRIALLYGLCRAARERYADLHGGSLRAGAIAGMLRYACRYALTENSLGPDLYHLVIAGRGFADDNFAQELWEVATTYPWQSAAPEIEPLEVSLRDLHSNVRNLRFRPKQLRRRRRLRQVVNPPPKERRPGEWAERFTDDICSFQPEDLAIEGYGDLLRRRSTRLLHDAATRSVRFTSTLGDGIDVRETLRNWHEKTIYVRLSRAVREQAGAIVVIFDDEPLTPTEPDMEPAYPWQMTWQGEGEEEGDMALYATDPFARIIGPGIGRALYGGFLLNRPAGTMFGVWSDDYFVDAKSKAEVLLLAALDHSSERIAVYVAPRPPRRKLKQIARRLGRKIIHIPSGQLSPAGLQKVRRFHVLSGPEVRAQAPRYIR